MMKIILNGAGGRMGRALRELLLSGDGSAVICAEVDKNSPDMPFKNIADYKDAADVIIDFSHHSHKGACVIRHGQSFAAGYMHNGTDGGGACSYP